MSAVAKVRTQFLCNQCGSVHPKWMGKCPDCGAWDSLEEYKQPAPDTRRDSLKASGTADIAQGADAMTLAEIDESVTARAPTRSEEHTSELQSLRHLVCRLLLEKKKEQYIQQL